jgi:hypothetical protein
MHRLSPGLLRGLQQTLLQESLTAERQASVFPRVQLELAQKRGGKVDDPPAYFTKNWQQECWLLLGFRAFSQRALDAWREIFNSAKERRPVYELTVNERILDRFLVQFQRAWLPADSLIYLPRQSDELYKQFLNALQIESRLNAYVYFLDRAARIRWRAVGAPPSNAPEAIERLLAEYFRRIPR